MVTPTIKSIYSLDVETVRQLESMAKRWNVSKSEALRRAIRASAKNQANETNDALDALDQLQSSLQLSAGGARQWAKRTGNERRASS